MTVDDDASAVRRPARKFPVVPFVLVAAAVIGVWQYWSWGPYTVTLEAEGMETKDFVVVCSYTMGWIHSVEGLYEHKFIMGHGQSVKCPRHFLGPLGFGMTASVTHPEYHWSSYHASTKKENRSIVLTPRRFSSFLDELPKRDDPKHVMSEHIYTLEHYYLPAFDAGERSALSRRYVHELQYLVARAGGFKYFSAGDPKSIEYIEDMFKRP